MKFDTNGLDAIDQEIIRKLIIARDQIGKPRIGDYVRFPTGQLERFSHDWGDGLQTSAGGSFFLCTNGGASFSGGLNPCTPADKLKLTNATLPGSFWIFHHDIAGAGRGVYFKIPCRVFITTAAYDGFLGKDFCSHEIDALKKQLESDPNMEVTLLNAVETRAIVQRIMEEVKADTGHYPTRSDFLRHVPPIGFALTNLDEAYDKVRRGIA